MARRVSQSVSLEMLNATGKGNGVLSSKIVTLLNGVTVTGRSIDIPIPDGYKSLTLEVLGTFTGLSLTIEGKSISGTPYSLQAYNVTTQSLSSTILIAGIYQIDVTGLNSINANATVLSGGNVTVQGKMVN